MMLMLAGCETISYYSQAVSGQWQILNNRQPIDQLLADSNTDDALKQRLILVKAIRQFATDKLQLPNNESYLYFADLKRPYVVWNVVATEALSVSPKQWCFPIAGCVEYRGYFSKQAAIAYADKLAIKGFDTHVRGVSAYSTLGWFADPILNTFINYDEIRLAGLIFHELAHQQFYLAGDTSFNESFARMVEHKGLSLWLNSPERLAALNNIAPDNLINDYLENQRIQDEFVELMLEGRSHLERLYQQNIDPELKLERKQRLIKNIKEKFKDDFQSKGPSYNSYIKWVTTEREHQQLNNAKLASISSYYQWVESFQQLLLKENNDLTIFYQRVKSLAKLDVKQRELILKRLKDKSTDQEF